MVNKVLKIAIVGGGPSGLCCLKHALDYGHDVTLYEQNSKVGGTWIYTDNTGHDEFGVPIHSSMYHGLLTNLPVDVMRFMDHPFPQTDRSFVPHEDVLAYLQSYADKFNLNRYIKFQHRVINVRPLPGDRWEVSSKDLKNNICETREFDAIFVCNGHYHAPFIPHFDGLEKFIGRKMHSHDYRRPDQLRNETVLVIGAASSGRDITHEVATKAKRVIWSNHSSLRNFELPTNVKIVGDVKCFNASSVQLLDGDVEPISCVLFCTGYAYSFPFLSVDCGLILKDRLHIGPLYKEVININHPSMALIALSTCITTYLRHDLQALLCLKYWSGENKLPSREEMLEEHAGEIEKRKNSGIDPRHCHLLKEELVDYLNELSEICQVNIVPKVFCDVFMDLVKLNFQYPTSYRDFNYKILDDKTFERKHISE